MHGETIKVVDAYLMSLAHGHQNFRCSRICTQSPEELKTDNYRYVIYIVSQKRESKRYNLIRISLIPAIWQRTHAAGRNADDMTFMLSAGDF